MEWYCSGVHCCWGKGIRLGVYRWRLTKRTYKYERIWYWHRRIANLWKSYQSKIQDLLWGGNICDDVYILILVFWRGRLDGVGLTCNHCSTFFNYYFLINNHFVIQVNECIFLLSIIFMTILCTPQPTVVRWSLTPPVSDEIKLQWKGFCAIIANAYYVRGMAWWERSAYYLFL